MADYIEREAAVKRLLEMAETAGKKLLYYEQECMETAAEVISGFPAADVAQVVHGRWVYHNFDTICSECRKSAIFDEWEQQAETEFCPHCGAKMDGEVVK